MVRWAVLTATSVAVVMSLSTWFSATAVLDELSNVLNLSSTEATWLANSVQIGFVVGAIGAAITGVTDKVRLQTLLAAAAILAALANGVIAIVPDFSVAMLARFVTGMALALVYPPALKFTSTWFVQNRGIAMGVVVGALSLGSALPHLFGYIRIGTDWKFVVCLTSIAAVIAGAIFWSLPTGPFSFTKTELNTKYLRQIVTHKPLTMVNLGYFGHMWELYAVWTWFLLFAQAANISNHDHYLAPRLLTFMTVAAGVFGSVVAGYLSDKYRRPIVVFGIVSISMLCSIGVSLSFDGPGWLFILMSLLWGSTIVADSAQYSALVADYAPSEIVGSALSFQMGIGFAISTVAIWLVPQMELLLGSWRWSFIVLMPGSILAAFAMLRLCRIAPKRHQ